LIARLLVNLTQPAVLCFNGHVPEDKSLRNNYLELESHLQALKEVRLQDKYCILFFQVLVYCNLFMEFVVNNLRQNDVNKNTSNLLFTWHKHPLNTGISIEFGVYFVSCQCYLTPQNWP